MGASKGFSIVDDLDEEENNQDPSKNSLVRTYFGKIGRIPLLTPEKERGLFLRKRDFQQGLLEQICLYDWTILARALGEYACVEDFDALYPHPEGFSGEGPFGKLDYSVFVEHHERSATASYSKPYQRILEQEPELKRADPEQREALLRKIAENYAEGLYYQPLEVACKNYQNRRVHDLQLAESESPIAEINQELASFNRKYFGHKEIRSLLIESNLRLVVSITKHYINRGMEFMDLISEGNLGLIKAVDMFRLNYGKLSTYAVCWIRQSITRYVLEHSHTIRLPLHLQEYLFHINRAKQRLSLQLDRIPTSSEIDQYLNWSSGRTDYIYGKLVSVVSLSQPLKKGEEIEFKDFIPDTTFSSPFDLVLESEVVRLTKRILSCLDKRPSEKSRKRRILEGRFGIGDGKAKTLDLIGIEERVTRERVRQIQASALKSVRNSPLIRKLNSPFF
ncbi:MAG: RNA polymerase sigma factor RpoD/SigA [Nanoarchaeota archaeon]